LRVDVVTLFPQMVETLAGYGVTGRAIDSGLLELGLWNPRDYTRDRHRTVDDRPYGGGPGMVMMCEPVFDALEHVESQGSVSSNRLPTKILLTPQGERFTQSIATELADKPWLIMLCGHYEGFDERIRTGIVAREISIGDYVLSGGETAAMVLVDSIVRLLPGVLGDDESAKNDSFVDGLLEYPQYTRPRNFRDMEVPEVLLSGDHGRIDAWRKEQALKRTQARRPDLLPDCDHENK